jgi:2-oxoglutarate ferredoxin oxidoreductase subunit beta
MAKKVFEITRGLTDMSFHYCPGCTHGIIHRLVAEALVEENLLDEAIGVSPVGCAYNNYLYFSCDMIQAAHGRAPAVATGVKRVHPDCTVFTYQGDGDLAAIGTAEIVHAAARGERITTIFVNNAVYGMTSGQMAPTSLVSEMLATLQGSAYIERVAVNSIRNIHAAKRAIRKAFRVQKAGLGFSMVELLSTCPTNWGMDPVKSLGWVDSTMIPHYPLGVFKGAALEV